MASPAMQLPPGAVLEDSPQADSSLQLPPGAELETAAPQEPAPMGSVGPQETGVRHWLQGVESDIRTGGTTTLPGRVLHALGAPGINSGVSEQTADQIAGPLIGPVKFAQGIAETPDHPVSGPVHAALGALQTASPALAFVAPEAAEATASGPGKVLGAIGGKSLRQTAGQLFESVGADANKIPVNLDNASEAVLKLMDWQKKTQLGPTVNKFLNRITNPKLGALTYEEARDYYKLLGRLSNEETSKLAPSVQNDLQSMVAGLKQDIGNAAAQAGREPDYYKAMGDYAKAARRQEILDVLKQHATPALIKGAFTALGAGGVAGTGYSLYKLLSDK